MGGNIRIIVLLYGNFALREGVLPLRRRSAFPSRQTLTHGSDAESFGELVVCLAKRALKRTKVQTCNSFTSRICRISSRAGLLSRHPNMTLLQHSSLLLLLPACALALRVGAPARSPAQRQAVTSVLMQEGAAV